MHHDVLTVTLNPTLDVSTTVAKLIDHAKLRCTPEREQVGGGGINVAQVLHSLGGNCRAFLPAGGTRGQEILEALAAAKLDTLPVPIAERNRQCFTVYESDTGHEYRFLLPGPELSSQELTDCLSAVLQNLPTQYLVLSGSLPPGVPEDFYATIIRAVRQRAPGLRIVVDTSGQALSDALDAGVFLCKPSREEFVELTGCDNTKAQKPRDLVAACRQLIDQGKSEVIALTLGADGALLVTAHQAWRVDPLSVKVTSTVGAGDSFVGGFIWSMLMSADWVKAVKVGTAAAAAALQTQGDLRFEGGAILTASESVVVTPA